jgi:hypothetical protein
MTTLLKKWGGAAVTVLMIGSILALMWTPNPVREWWTGEPPTRYEQEVEQPDSNLSCWPYPQPC